jgi:hypothetical protein
MAEPKVGNHPEKGLTVGHRIEDDPSTDNDSVVDAQKYAYSDDRKIGITGAVFLILNKMIGTGSKSWLNSTILFATCTSSLTDLKSSRLPLVSSRLPALSV